MDKELGKDFIKSQREQYLKDNCDKVEEKGYMKPFSPAELQGHKEELGNLSIKIEELEDSKKAQIRYFKSQLDPLIEKRREMVSNIKRKSKYVTEICYKFVDHATHETGYYNAEGDLIESRPSTADELQTTLFAVIRKNGTDDDESIN